MVGPGGNAPPYLRYQHSILLLNYGPKIGGNGESRTHNLSGKSRLLLAS